MAKSSELADVQADIDNSSTPVARAGIKSLVMPVCFIDADGHSQNSVAQVSVWAKVATGQRGAHMSRLSIAAAKLREDLTLGKLVGFTSELTKTMQAPRAGIEISFPLFINKTAPVSNEASWLDVMVELSAEATDSGDFSQLKFSLTVPVTMLCPCSKRIAEQGAHNQRGRIILEATVEGEPPCLLALATELEQCASSQLYSVIKRSDEKYLTELAYDNPRFVEDTARQVAGKIGVANAQRYGNWQVTVITDESIHNHDAFAIITSSDQASAK